MQPRLFTLLNLSLIPLSALAASPYAGQQTREIKALSSEEVSSLLSGKGMGLAKAAELNGYAGPAHVLELAEKLHLSADQRARTEALFSSMSRKAAAAGEALVQQERELDRLFSSKAITEQSLAESLSKLGELQARVRAAHLEAHLAQVQILTPEQNALYAELRGYGNAAEQGAHEHRH